MNPIEVMKSFSKAQAGIAGLASGMSLVGGAALGAAIAMKRLSGKLEEKYAELSDKEIAEAKAFYSRHYKSEQFATVAGTVEALKETEDTVVLENAAMALLAYKGVEVGEDSPADDEDTTLVEVVRNVFTDADPAEFDYEEELKNRDPDVPYVISEDEWNQSEFDYTQVEYTFYEGDEILTNERDQPIDMDIVGAENMKKFGYGSNDQNMVYVRNVRLSLDCLILRSVGEYSKEVLDFIEHSHQPKLKFKPRKFRGDDD